MQQWYQCPRCGAPVAFGARFCGACGAFLFVETKETQRGASPWLIALVVFIAIVFLVGGVLLFRETGSQVTSSPPPPSQDQSSVPKSPPAKIYDPSLPTGMGAFRGKALWGDRPVVSGTVIADTKHPVVVVPPWESYSAKYKQFSIETDNQGNYLLLVEPGDYYVGCCMPGSDYISYQTLGSLPGLFGVSSHQVAIGEVVTVNLLALDWSIELVSPDDTGSTITKNPPTLVWKQYDWAKYGEVGYYQVELSIYEDGYHTAMKGKTESTSYVVPTPLKAGKYRWEVRAYTKTGKEIAACIGWMELYILAP